MKRSLYSKTSYSLVWLSLLSLALFLIYWNVSEYQNKKNELISDLEDQMSLAQSAHNDSLLLSIISFVQRDSVDIDDFTTHLISIGKAMQLNGNKQTRIDVDNHIEGALDSIAFVISDGFTTLESQENLNSSATIEVNATIIDKSGRKQLSTNDFGKGDGIGFLWDELANNKLVSDYFYQNLIEKNLPKSYSVVLRDSIKHENGVFVHVSNEKANSQGNMVYYFSHTNAYILRKMLLGIVGSFILFSVIALSFFSMIKNWKKQNQLATIKDQFISNMTHELKTPISTISVALQALSDYGVMQDLSKREEYIDMSKHEINRLNLLVDKVMQMSFLESGEMKLDKELIEFKDLVTNLLSTLELHFRDHQAEVTFQVEGDHFLMIGDRMHLTHLLYNLIDNAIKYSHSNPVININVSEEKNTLCMTITDHGIGIDPEHHQKVFDRFYRITERDIHDVKGYGIGLHYAADIVSKHQGTISLDSELDKGAVITIKLPKKND